GDENSATERTETETTWSTWWNEEHGGSEPLRRSQKRRYEAVSDHEQPTKRRWPPAPQELARWGSNSSWRSAQSDGSRSEWSSWNNGGISQHDEDDIKQWLECSNVGDNVPETPIVPCKTPFEGWLADCAYQNGMLEDHQWFGKQELLQSCDEQGTPLGLVIDLVNTSKYYSGFQSCDGVEYHKVKIPGRCVPERDTLEEVFDIIDEFSERKPDLYVAIHCTHGLNRTGFLIAAYLMTRRSTPHWRDAVAVFEKARGGRIDKAYLLEALQQLEEGQY
ncbi:Putative tyrosine-protein phosphatase 1 (Protein-tyrosine phosphatase 1), partial [Durusdinium trenchii]